MLDDRFEQALARSLPPGVDERSLRSVGSYLEATRENSVVDGEFDYDETVDLVLHREGEEAPLAINRVSLAQAVQAVVDQWSPSQPGSVLIIRDGPDITSYDDVMNIYNREGFPRAPKGRAEAAADRSVRHG
jgi:hypothetical protein